ncbi:MAG: DUF1189 family protein [Firmicutes bacterium]|nr:DUF1189 family protein [Bacillota bacterium]
MIKLFAKACYAFDEYSELVKTSWIKIFFYFIVVNAVTFALYLPGFYLIINENVPEFTISDGIFSTESKMDEDRYGVKYLIDTDKDFSNEDLSGISNGLAIDAHKIIAKNYGITQQMPMKEIEMIGIVDKSSVVSLFMVLFVSFGIFFYYFVVIIKVMFYVFMTMFLSLMLKNIISYPKALKITILSLTFPEILRAVLMLFSVTMPNIVYFLMMSAYLYFILKNIKKNGESTERKQGKQNG